MNENTKNKRGRSEPLMISKEKPETYRYELQETVIVVNRHFSGSKTIGELILERISTKKRCEN